MHNQTISYSGKEIIMMGSSMMLMMVLMGGGGGNDLVDYIDTNSYWALQSVEVTVPAMKAQLMPADAKAAAALAKDLIGDDEAKATAAAAKIKLIGLAAMPHLEKAARDAQGKPEKAGRVQNLIGQLYSSLQGPAVRRLMAIRTLGELKKTDALATLTPLLKSKTLFEAEYAAAAIAAIGGKEFKRPGLAAKDLIKDVYLLPVGCGVVGQVTMPPGKPVDIAKAIKAMGNMGGMGGQNPQNMLPQLTQMITMAAGQVGNVRIDAVTLGVAENVGNDTGFVVVIARGLYDTKALKEMLLQAGRSNTETIDGTEVFSPDKEFAIFMPSSDRLVLVAGPRKAAKPVAEMIAAVKAGKGSLTVDSKMGKLIKTVDTASPIWAASIMSETYRQAPMLMAVDTITLTSKIAKGVQNFKLTAVGSDAEKIAQAVKEFDGHMAEGRAQLTKQAERMPMFKPMAEFVNSIKAVADGKTATVTASMKGGSPFTSMLMSIMPMVGMRSSSTVDVQEVDAPQEAPGPR
jgi:hypothetical protein